MKFSFKKCVSTVLASAMCMGVFGTGICSETVSADEGSAHEAVASFVSRLYSVCLDREADESGLNYWSELLAMQKITGVCTAYDFVFSDEFKAQNYSNEEYVEHMYETFFDREADEAGLNYWVDLLNNGASREDVFAGVSGSDEFYSLCEGAGILCGNYFAGYDITSVSDVNCFVARQYAYVLGRTTDKDGLAYWTKSLLDLNLTGSDFLMSIVFSDEFCGNSYCSRDFTYAVYEAVLGRYPSNSEVEYWAGAINNGGTRDEIFNGFVNSPEFRDMCASYGIEAGTGNSSGHDATDGFCSYCGAYSGSLTDYYYQTILPSVGHAVSEKVFNNVKRDFDYDLSYYYIENQAGDRNVIRGIDGIVVHNCTDFDNDGSPELMVVRLVEEEDPTFNSYWHRLYIDLYAVVNGRIVLTDSMPFEFYNEEGYGYIHAFGRIDVSYTFMEGVSGDHKTMIIKGECETNMTGGQGYGANYAELTVVNNKFTWVSAVHIPDGSIDWTLQYYNFPNYDVNEFTYYTSMDWPHYDGRYLACYSVTARYSENAEQANPYEYDFVFTSTDLV